MCAPLLSEREQNRLRFLVCQMSHTRGGAWMCYSPTCLKRCIHYVWQWLKSRFQILYSINICAKSLRLYAVKTKVKQETPCVQQENFRNKQNLYQCRNTKLIREVYNSSTMDVALKTQKLIYGCFTRINPSAEKIWMYISKVSSWATKISVTNMVTISPSVPDLRCC